MSDPTIISAIIAGCVAIIAPIITLLLKEIVDQKPFRKLSERRKTLLGKWNGTLTQDEVPVDWPTEIEISLTFTKHGKRIIGKAIFTPSGRDPRHMEFVGGFLHEQFVKLDYSNSDTAIIQFGCYLAHLITTDDSKVLKGRYVGYGPDTRDIVRGTATLTKLA